MTKVNVTIAAVFAASAALVASSCTSKKMNYPTAPSDDTVDEYFGTTVPDPYRPLENDTSEATAKWVEAENAVTNSYLEKFRSASRCANASLTLITS